MNLLSRIKGYSQDTLMIREDYNQKLKNLNSVHESVIRDINKKIDLLNNEINENLLKIENCKKLIHQKITIEAEKNAYQIISDYIDEFKIEEDIFTPDPTTKTLEELKKDLLKLLQRNLEIKEVNLKQMDLEIQKADKAYKLKFDELKDAFDKSIEHIRDPLIYDYHENRKRCVDIDKLSEVPKVVLELPKVVTIGNYLVTSNEQLREISDEDHLQIPIDIDLINNGNVVLKIDTNTLYNSNNIENIITGIALKYIQDFPSGHLKVGIFSPSITSFGKLHALLSALIKERISISQEECRTREQFSKMLSGVIDKCNMIHTKLLASNCNNLYELYDKNIQTEDFQLVIVHDVFRDMTPENMHAFYGCVSELSKCGLRFIIIDDFAEDNFKNKSVAFMTELNKILSDSNVFDLTKENIVDINGNPVLLCNAESFSSQMVYSFACSYAEYVNTKKATYLSYEKVGFGTQNADHTNFESIVIPVALNDPYVWEIAFDCVGHSPNANLIVGIPGTGKSTLIDSLIMNGAMKYSPNELNFQLLDFKDGISSSVYTMEECKIPHIKVVSQNNKPEEADIILSNILAESERRNKEFMSLRDESGEAIRNIVEYNRLVASGKYQRKNMPRLIIVIDECQYLFEDEGLAKKCQEIVRKCRSQGIHLILATQTLSHKMWGTIKFVEGIYCFEIAKDDAEQLLRNRKYVSMISTEIPKGSYMAFASNNSGEDCTKIRIAFDGGNTAKYSSQIRNKWSTYPVDMVTIGDKSPKELTVNEFVSLLKTCDQYELPLGENYTDHSLLTISYYKKRPMLLLGSNQDSADNIIKNVVFAAMQRKVKTYVIDASHDQNLTRDCQVRIDNMLKEGIINQNDFIIFGDERNYLETLQSVYTIYKDREANLRAENPPVIFVVNGIQSIIDFLNNTKSQAIEEQPKVAPTSIKELIAARQAEKRASGVTVNGKDTLIPFLFANAYKANIFLVLSFDTLTLTNDMGEKVLMSSQRELLRNADYKLLYPNCTSDVRSVMEDSFKEKLLNGLNENMAFLAFEQRVYYKLRFYQITKEN